MKKTIIITVILLCFFSGKNVRALTTFNNVEQFNQAMTGVDHHGDLRTNGGSMVASFISGGDPNNCVGLVQFNQDVFIGAVETIGFNGTGHASGDFNSLESNAIFESATSGTIKTCNKTSPSFGSGNDVFNIRSECNYLMPAYTPFCLYFNVPWIEINYNTKAIQLFGTNSSTSNDYQPIINEGANWVNYDPLTAVNYYIDENVASTTYATEIRPFTPTNCASTTVYNSTATGWIINNLPSNATWSRISIIFTDITSGSSSVFSQDIIVHVNENKLYSIPYNLATGTYSVSYHLNGWNVADPYTLETFDYSCPGTYIGEPTGIQYEIAQCQSEYESTQDQCDNTSAFSVERYTCLLGKTVRGIFDPSCTSTVTLNYTLNEVKNRAPYNYIVTLGSFFTDLVNPTTTATTGVVELADSLGTLTPMRYIRTGSIGLIVLLFGLALFKTGKTLFK